MLFAEIYSFIHTSIIKDLMNTVINTTTQESHLHLDRGRGEQDSSSPNLLEDSKESHASYTHTTILIKTFLCGGGHMFLKVTIKVVLFLATAAFLLLLFFQWHWIQGEGQVQQKITCSNPNPPPSRHRTRQIIPTFQNLNYWNSRKYAVDPDSKFKWIYL